MKHILGATATLLITVSYAPALSAANSASETSPDTWFSASQTRLTPSRPPVSESHPDVESASRAVSTELPYLVAAAPTIAYDWDMVLQNYISAPDETGLARFNYGALKANSKDRATLAAYITDLENTDISTLSEAEAITYWANLYNAVTIKVVTDNYPVKSIRNIKSGAFSPGPWKRNLVTVNGKKMSLDDIEHKTLRKKYPSPLVHYMVNCASVGCPNLKSNLWSAATLDADREQAARDFINSPRGVLVTDKGLQVSEIYKWFKEDFGTSKENILSHIRQYADEDLAKIIDEGARIVSYDYDWSLNE